jgi:hypothetical protein
MCTSAGSIPFVICWLMGLLTALWNQTHTENRREGLFTDLMKYFAVGSHVSSLYNEYARNYTARIKVYNQISYNAKLLSEINMTSISC